QLCEGPPFAVRLKRTVWAIPAGSRLQGKAAVGGICGNTRLGSPARKHQLFDEASCRSSAAPAAPEDSKDPLDVTQFSWRFLRASSGRSPRGRETRKRSPTSLPFPRADVSRPDAYSSSR